MIYRFACIVPQRTDYRILLNGEPVWHVLWADTELGMVSVLVPEPGYGPGEYVYKMDKVGQPVERVLRGKITVFRILDEDE